MKKTKSPPAYLKVARDIAGRIASGEIQEGQRFSGRSLMSSQYNVSPETIRRALGLLTQMDVVIMKPYVGVVVKSRENAARYVNQYGEAIGMRLLKEELATLMKKRREIDAQIEKTIQRLVDIAERFRNSDVMQTYEFTVPEGASIDGMTIAESAFRKQTGATILAIRRDADVTLSPSPDFKIAAGDVLVVFCGVLLVSVVSEFISRPV
jgi:K+/H+ antiporter YhaU regulatory subunit KhtT